LWQFGATSLFNVRGGWLRPHAFGLPEFLHAVQAVHSFIPFRRHIKLAGTHSTCELGEGRKALSAPPVFGESPKPKAPVLIERSLSAYCPAKDLNVTKAIILLTSDPSTPVSGS
jgi:hypothetical protein